MESSSILQESNKDFFMSYEFRNRRFTQYILKQKAIAELVNRIVFGQTKELRKKKYKKVIVAIGNFKGYKFMNSYAINATWRRALSSMRNVEVVDIENIYH